MSGSPGPARWLDQPDQVAAWRAAQARLAAQQRNDRARPWRRRARGGIAGLISNSYAGVRAARREEASGGQEER